MGQKNSFSSKHTKEDFNFDKPVLIASGSKHPKSIEQISDFMKKGGKTIGIDVSQKPNIGWVVEQVRQTFMKNPAIVLHIQTQGIDNIDLKNAGIIFGSVVSNVLKEIKPPTLIISGGYSAEMIANQMGWKSFWVKHELFYGLVAMHTEQSGCILFKPGSYFEHNLYSELNLLNW